MTETTIIFIFGIVAGVAVGVTAYRLIAAILLKRSPSPTIEIEDDPAPESFKYRIKVKPGTHAILPGGGRIIIDEAYISTITETGSYLPQADGTYMRFTDPDLYISPDCVG